MEDVMTEEAIRERLKYAYNCLSRFGEIDSSTLEGLKDELDYLRRTMLSSRPEILESKESLQEARQSFPRKILQAITTIADINPVCPSSNHLTVVTRSKASWTNANTHIRYSYKISSKFLPTIASSKLSSVNGPLSKSRLQNSG
jgi:hypothetical protein